MKKVYVVGVDWCNITSFLKFPIKIIQDISQADIVMFTGGADINPKLYGEKAISQTYYSDTRDQIELQAFKDCPDTALKIGGCRGAQLLTALSGGRLIQHVTGHSGGTHLITDSDTNQEFIITSCHHQMMYPYDMPSDQYKLLAWSTTNRSTYYLTEKGALNIDKSFKEPEIVYYSGTNSFCIQGHPEWMSKESSTIEYINNLIKCYLKTY